jgi:hypothetical protein
VGQSKPRSGPSRRKSPEGAPRRDQNSLHYAAKLIHRVCCFAGSASLIDDVHTDLRENGIPPRPSGSDTPAIFHWMMAAFSHQGISDEVAAGYMDRHGSATWEDLKRSLAIAPACPRLKSYWHFDACRYDKTSRTCSEPDHIARCPLPHHPLRNGRLNQTAYSLFLFVRDVAGSDFVGWVDAQLKDVDAAPDDDERTAHLQEALIGPLRNVYGVADKVLTMTLSSLLIGAAESRPVWMETGANMIAIDTLVHNFMHRTGIMRRFRAEHAYGTACYQRGACADIIRVAASEIDARKFNSTYPASFPRFVQHAIWQYCAQQGLNICNGNKIDDSEACIDRNCHLSNICGRIPLRNP